jgi:hypothetical protein
MDEEIKKLLVELNMEHLLDSSEQLQMIPVSDKVKQVTMPLKHKNEEKIQKNNEEQQVLWQEVITEQKQEAKAQSFIKKNYVIIKKCSLITLLFLGFLFAYLQMMHEMPLPNDGKIDGKEEIVAQNSEMAPDVSSQDERVPTFLVHECESARKEALEKIAAEISQLIQQQIEHKQPHFASQLTQLVAKCQATDEEYQEKIANLCSQLESFANK